MKTPHAKGSAFEREIAKSLSLWISNGKDGYIFARRSGSGGAMRDKTGNSGSGGDIFAEKHEGEWFTNHLSLELKFYKDLTKELWRYLANKPSKIAQFIGQAKGDADVYGKHFLLVAKCNYHDSLAITDSKVIQQLMVDNMLYKRCYGGYGWGFFPFEELLKIDPNTIKKECEQ